MVSMKPSNERWETSRPMNSSSDFLLEVVQHVCQTRVSHLDSHGTDRDGDRFRIFAEGPLQEGRKHFFSQLAKLIQIVTFNGNGSLQDIFEILRIPAYQSIKLRPGDTKYPRGARFVSTRVL